MKRDFYRLNVKTSKQVLVAYQAGVKDAGIDNSTRFSRLPQLHSQ